METLSTFTSTQLLGTVVSIDEHESEDLRRPRFLNDEPPYVPLDPSVVPPGELEGARQVHEPMVDNSIEALHKVERAARAFFGADERAYLMWRRTYLTMRFAEIPGRIAKTTADCQQNDLLNGVPLWTTFGEAIRRDEIVGVCIDERHLVLSEACCESLNWRSLTLKPRWYTAPIRYGQLD